MGNKRKRNSRAGHVKVDQWERNPGPAHFKAPRHPCHYLMNTIDVCLIYGPSDTTADNTLVGYEKFLDTSPETDVNTLVGYTDADYATCVDTRRSHSGFVAMLNSGPVNRH